MFNWLRQRNTGDPLVESDARALIERFGAGAYFEARLRQHDDQESIIDGNRPPGHWKRVKYAIVQMMAHSRG